MVKPGILMLLVLFFLVATFWAAAYEIWGKKPAKVTGRVSRPPV